MRFAPALGLVALVSTASCTVRGDSGNIDVSVIGNGFALPDPDRTALSPPDRILSGAVWQGLVALDADGKVEPALAESWIVTSDGLSTIFRIRAAGWRDGASITGDDVAKSLNRAIAANSRNPIKPLLGAVDAFVGMTGRVVEVRLRTPRPNLLQLLAQPELAIRRNGSGIGVFRIAAMSARRVRLVPLVNEEDPAPPNFDPVVLRADRAARAIARFNAGESKLVMGGTFADWPLLREADARPGRIRFDPVQGLFGLAVVGKSSFLASNDVRAALAMAIDRSALAAAFRLPGWTTSDAVLPAQLDSALPVARPDWSGSTIAQRRADAAARIANWRQGVGSVAPLRVALPAGPGMRLLFARIAADWRRIGVRVVVVPLGSRDADLRLIDAVAPNTSANWYLTTLSCAAGLVCDARGDVDLEASRAADTLIQRSARLADADAVLATRASFIALGVPMRWSLVNPLLSGWQENVLGAHPLWALRPPRPSEI